jgi:hypothetical protein
MYHIQKNQFTRTEVYGISTEIIRKSFKEEDILLELVNIMPEDGTVW